MATDVRRSRRRTEEARLRTARVLANVATGVIAVERCVARHHGEPRASELVLGDETLAPGNVSRDDRPGWRLSGRRSRSSRREPRRDPGGEFDVGGRQIRVQLALLGAAPDGCVIARDDATALDARGARRSPGRNGAPVAHEIKNPLRRSDSASSICCGSARRVSHDVRGDAQGNAERICGNRPADESSARFRGSAHRRTRAAAAEPVDLAATAAKCAASTSWRGAAVRVRRATGRPHRRSRAKTR